MNETTQKFDCWCLVELFGHQKIAGRCTEQNIAGTNMLRVDVPETAGQPAFTRFFGSSAIYAINPIDEQTCRFMVDKLEVKPIESWNIQEVIKKHNQLLLEKTADSEQREEQEKESSSDHDDDFDDDKYFSF